MVMGVLWTGMVLLSLGFALATGQGEAVGAAALSAGGEAVALLLRLAGPMLLWSGVMEVMNEASLTDKLSRLLSGVLPRLFPTAARDRTFREALCCNVSANLLGLGNAATPAGIRAAQTLAERSGGRASNELVRLVVLNTASVQLLPTTVAALRSAAGASSPLDILPAVWLTSLISVSAGLLAARTLSRVL